MSLKSRVSRLEEALAEAIRNRPRQGVPTRPLMATVAAAIVHPHDADAAFACYQAILANPAFEGFNLHADVVYPVGTERGVAVADLRRHLIAAIGSDGRISLFELASDWANHWRAKLNLLGVHP